MGKPNGQGLATLHSSLTQQERSKENALCNECGGSYNLVGQTALKSMVAVPKKVALPGPDIAMVVSLMVHHSLRSRVMNSASVQMGEPQSSFIGHYRSISWLL